jgi:L-aminopeptidase/D-esterase-like protein
MDKMKVIDFTEIDGIKIGNAQDLKAATGCTVVICEQGAAAGVDVRGGAPSTRETDLLNSLNLVQKIHAVILCGGSAFGLDAAAGVMRYLEEKSIGFDVQVARVPIVCGAALFDLTIGDPRIRPDKEMGYKACLDAGSAPSRQGNVGAGAGATVGKILGMGRAMKSGLGCYALQIGNLQIGAAVAVNCMGDVVDPEAGTRLAGPLDEDGCKPRSTEEIMVVSYADKKNLFRGNTTIGVVATNAALTKSEAAKIASMAQNGYATTIRPAHSMYDGDTVFAMSTGCVEADLTTVGFLAARVIERAVIAAVKTAALLCERPSYSDLMVRNLNAG